MMKKLKFSTIALFLALALCLLPAVAYATADGADGSLTAQTPEESPAPETAGEAAPAPEDEPAEEAPQAIYNGPMDTLFTLEGSVVYNNGGTVYNNGGTVYNNEGLVYNNGGTVYNNAGTVYGNGGVIYNNGGTVYDNGSTVYENGPVIEAPAPEATEQPEAEEPAEETEEPAEETAEPAEETVEPAEGTEGPAEETVEPAEETVEPAEETVEPAAAPVFSLEPGTYGEGQLLEISADEGAAIYYSTDGSEPTAESLKYEDPIPLSEGAVFKAVAIAPGAEPSEVTQAAYAVIRVTGPEFEPVEEGYTRPAVQPLLVENLGTVDAKITGVKLTGDDARRFYLSHTRGGELPAGETEAELWEIQPNAGLSAGTYSAVILISLDGGATLELPLVFTVQ